MTPGEEPGDGAVALLTIAHLMITAVAGGRLGWQIFADAACRGRSPPPPGRCPARRVACG